MRQSNGASAFPASQDEEVAEDQVQEGSSASEKSYDKQDNDWFVRGRYLKIFARENGDSDSEIHKKEFILLDSKNTEGTGVRVDRLASKKLPSGWIWKYVEVVGPATSESSDEKAHSVGKSSNDRLQGTHAGSTQIALEEIGCDNKGLQDCYARLDHTYSIPFSKYRCQDLGILSKESLAVLRLRYIGYLANEWNLVQQARDSLDKLLPTPAASLLSSSPSGSTAASLNTASGIPSSNLPKQRRGAS
jgi:hypothetical protein